MTFGIDDWKRVKRVNSVFGLGGRCACLGRRMLMIAEEYKEVDVYLHCLKRLEEDLSKHPSLDILDNTC